MSKSASSGCALDSNSCVTLDKILTSFGAPVSEEQAWAICYTTIQCYLGLEYQDRSKVLLITSLKHIFIHKDGYIHSHTFIPPAKGRGRSRSSSEGKMVCELGVVLYKALDFGLGTDEERDLSPALDNLIDRMTSAESERGETDDEGIERDSGDSDDEATSSSGFSLREVLQLCEDRLATQKSETGIPEHYRAVVRALVAEALDLSFFLRKVAESTKLVAQHQDLLSSEQDLHQLQTDDWARLWKQVMNQLRAGVKLKKVEYTQTPLEYTLTPYEMLMEDIRSRRYTLNKVMINGDIPMRVKKDAHTIILDFIRSRPPLRKASERKLLPRRKTSSPMELLMESIKQEHRLKHVGTPVRARPMSFRQGRVVETSRHHMLSRDRDCSSHSNPPVPRKKLIAAPRFNLSAEDDDDDDDLSDIPPSSPQLQRAAPFGSSKTSENRNNSSIHSTPVKSSSTSPWSRMAFDLATYGTTGTPERRHSITICETPIVQAPSVEHSPAPNSTSLHGSPSLSTTSTPPSTPRTHHDTQSSSHNFMQSASQTQRDFLSSKHFSSGLDCLALTLEEVVHIRNVLTKADLEALPLDLSIKEDMAKGKICFLCMKTRFGFFGPRGQECRLCKRTICKKCMTKMRIPTEHFSNIPVMMLTPQALSPREEEEDQSASLSRTFLNRLQELPKSGIERRSSLGSVGSAPSSPTTSRSSQGPTSLPPQQQQIPAPCVAYDIRRKQEMRQRNQLIEEKLRGELMAVCGDCKAMVIHILMSIKIRREQQLQQQPAATTPQHPQYLPQSSPQFFTQQSLPVTPQDTRSHLHLNLTPVYQ